MLLSPDLLSVNSGVRVQRKAPSCILVHCVHWGSVTLEEYVRFCIIGVGVPAVTLKKVPDFRTCGE